VNVQKFAVKNDRERASAYGESMHGFMDDVARGYGHRGILYIWGSFHGLSLETVTC
jgi:hypothetical protein